MYQNLYGSLGLIFEQYTTGPAYRVNSVCNFTIMEDEPVAALDTFTIKWRLGVLLLFSALLIGACGGSDAPDSASTEEAPIATSVSASGSAASTPTSVPEQTSGGGTIGLDDALIQGIGLYEELLDVLADITDVGSARAAADDVTRIVRQFEELDKRIEEYSEAEIASAAITNRFQNFGQELGREMFRISVIPGAGDLLGEAFENLGGGETPPSTLTDPAGRPLETVAPVVGTDTPPSNANLICS